MRVVVVDGPIAAGKSTALELVAQQLRARGHTVAAVPEPVEQWRALGALEAFYADPRSFGYAFQTLVYATRITVICEALEGRAEPPDFLLLERSPATDAIFMAVQDLTPIEQRMYDEWRRAHDRALPFALREADAFYLDLAPAGCAERLRRRDRREEAGVSDAYQARLIAAHEEALFGPSPPYGTVHRIDAAVPAADVAQAIVAALFVVPPGHK